MSHNNLIAFSYLLAADKLTFAEFNILCKHNTKEVKNLWHSPCTG
jgi:hypothetical protein